MVSVWRAVTSEGPDIGRRRLQQNEVGERPCFRIICLHKHLPPVLDRLLGAASLLGAPHSATCTGKNGRMRSPAMFGHYRGRKT
jgi:hypothetical protein